MLRRALASGPCSESPGQGNRSYGLSLDKKDGSPSTPILCVGHMGRQKSERPVLRSNPAGLILKTRNFSG